MDSAIPVTPGQTYRLSGVRGASVDAVYFGAKGERIVRDVPQPYDFAPLEGETHVQVVLRVDDHSEHVHISFD